MSICWYALFVELIWSQFTDFQLTKGENNKKKNQKCFTDSAETHKEWFFSAEHLETHKERPALDCPHCDVVVRTKKGLDGYIKGVHGDGKKFQCSYCDKKFFFSFAANESHEKNTEYSSVWRSVQMPHSQPCVIRWNPSPCRVQTLERKRRSSSLVIAHVQNGKHVWVDCHFLSDTRTDIRWCFMLVSILERNRSNAQRVECSTHR